MYKTGAAAAKLVANKGYELSLSPDGKRLLYTVDAVGTRRILMVYEADSRKSRETVSGIVRDQRWSPDGSKISFLKIVGDAWQIWVMPFADFSKSAGVSTRNIDSQAGWTPDGKTIVAADTQQMYWIGLDGKVAKTVPLATIYGKEFDPMGGDAHRFKPGNPDVLLVSANYVDTPKGAPVDAMDLNSTLFLYDFKSAKRTLVLSTKVWGRGGEWSPAGDWIYFERLESQRAFSAWRIHPDGSGLEKVLAGAGIVISQ
jgi:Tol biopolymer transport system component